MQHGQHLIEKINSMLKVSVGNGSISSAVLGLGEPHSGMEHSLLEVSAFCPVILGLALSIKRKV